MRGILDVYSDLSFAGGLKAPFIGKGNIWIENAYQPDDLRLAQCVLHEALTKTAPGQLSVWGYDSNLSGIFAPFAALSAGESRLLDLIGSQKDLVDRLDYTRQQIQTVQNVIQGRAGSLLDFRASAGRPVESYKLIVLSMDMGVLDPALLAKLSLLMRVGPRYGFSFLIISTTQMDVEIPGRGTMRRPVKSIAPNITVLEAGENQVRIQGGPYTSYCPPEPQEIIRRCEAFLEKKESAEPPVVTFAELHEEEEPWSRSSVSGLTFSVGLSGVNSMEITIGDEVNQRHNAVITGAVGQGKSNLISVIIHSLCWRYSPRELQLYLLDFKEGVTFKPFSNIGQEAYLPHARALGLESDTAFGIAVLESLYQEYLRRMKLLKEQSVKSLRELRERYPEKTLPRIVTIIDEFQMMFGEDMQTGQKAAELLEKSVRLFRAAGIHFILASQTLSGNVFLSQRRESIFGQIPIRIALKNSVSESLQTLGINNPAAAFLKPREAVVNLDYGEASQNRTTMIAFADEEVLRSWRENWWKKARWEFPAPYAFESDRRITISSSLERLRLQQWEMGAPVAFAGDKISVDGEQILLPLSNDPGRNIAVIGTPDADCNQAVGILQSIAVSLAAQEQKARFLFCDFQGTYTPQFWPDFDQLMGMLGCPAEDIRPEEFESQLAKLLEQADLETPVYVFGFAMDRWSFTPDFPGQDSVLKTFVEKGPSKGLHFIGWWVKASSFTQQTAGYGSSDAFNSKLFLRIDERAVQSLTGPFVKWTARSNRALVSDSVEFAEEMAFIPYAPVTWRDVENFAAFLREEDGGFERST